MTLLEKQNEFVRSLTRFFNWLELNGYEVSLGEAYRPDWVAKMYWQQDRGIQKSLHVDRCAIDLNLFKRGVWLTNVDDLREAGTFWESMSVPGLKLTWGGLWDPPDADHFQLT